MPFVKRLVCRIERMCFNINRWYIHFLSQTGFLRTGSLNGSKAAPWLTLLYNVKGSKSFNTCENTKSVILIILQVIKAGNKSKRHQKCRLIFSGVLRNKKPAFSKAGLKCSKTLRCDEKLSQQFFERARTAGLNFQIQFCRDMQNRIFKKMMFCI